jgi:hypothetical protein
MELILRLYLLAYDPDYPVICFDERPCFLIGNTVEGLAMQAGKVAKENYAYSKHGSCTVLAAIEPKTGKRIAHVRRQRTKKEFCFFMKDLAEQYPNAKKIKLVIDNLNTHNASSFYEHLPAEQAEALMNRLEFIYTPKSASWLNMIEIEFSALSRMCLNRRIPCMLRLEMETLAFFKERTRNKVKINWQFTVEQARAKLNSHYTKVNLENTKYI